MKPRISYVGIHAPSIARNIVALKGLRITGEEVTVLIAEGGTWKKYLSLIRLLRKHRALTDVWLVAYLSGVAVPFVRLFGGGLVIYNAANSFYESVVLDRKRFSRYSPSAVLIWMLDWLTFTCADIVLAESEAQKRFLSKIFFLSKEKIQVVFTGADDAAFFPDQNVKKHTEFSVGFRGGFLPATGIECIIDAAELLKDEPIEFYLYGRGMLLSEIRTRVTKKNLTRVRIVDAFLDQEALRESLLSCHVLLGQFSAHERLERTIQNKTFEALALQMPYLTLRTTSNMELLIHAKSCYFIEKSDAQQLADAIRVLKAHTEMRDQISRGAAQVYEDRGTPRAIGRVLQRIIREIWERRLPRSKNYRQSLRGR